METLNPNCSEAVMRVRTDKMTPEQKDKLFKELETKFDSSKNDEACDTSVSEEEIFGIPTIKIDGDEAFNNSEEIQNVLDENEVMESWVETEE